MMSPIFILLKHFPSTTLLNPFNPNNLNHLWSPINKLRLRSQKIINKKCKKNQKLRLCLFSLWVSSTMPTCFKKNLKSLKKAWYSLENCFQTLFLWLIKLCRPRKLSFKRKKKWFLKIRTTLSLNRQTQTLFQLPFPTSSIKFQ